MKNEDDKEDDVYKDAEAERSDDDFDDSHPGPSGLGDVSEVNSGTMGGTISLHSHSLHSSYSTVGSLCPYSPSPLPSPSPSPTPPLSPNSPYPSPPSPLYPSSPAPSSPPSLLLGCL